MRCCEPRLRFPAGILRNPVIPFFPKLLERNCDSTLAGKLPGARPENRSVWSSVEIDVGFKNKYASYYFCPNISMLLFALTAVAALLLLLPSCRCCCAERSHRDAVAAVPLPSCLHRAGAAARCCHGAAATPPPLPSCRDDDDNDVTTATMTIMMQQQQRGQRW